MELEMNKKKKLQVDLRKVHLFILESKSKSRVVNWGSRSRAKEKRLNPERTHRARSGKTLKCTECVWEWEAGVFERTDGQQLLRQNQEVKRNVSSDHVSPNVHAALPTACSEGD